MLSQPLLSIRGRYRAVLLLVLVAVSVGLVATTRTADLEAQRVTVSQPIPYHPALATLDGLSLDRVALDNHRPPREFTIGRGQTMARLLVDLGVEAPSVPTALSTIAEHVDLRRVRAGESGLARYASNGEFKALRMEVTGRGWLHLEREAGQFRSSLREYVRSTSMRAVAGSLDSVLFADIQRAGGSPQVAYAMADVLQWDLDFNRDLRRGDRFRVLYEEVTLDGRVSEIGRVLALEYENRNIVHQAYLFDDGETEGYYDADGRPLQKMFLRSPLPFTRVTSRFSHSRFHPVLKRNRPHYGVDLGAPRGTPVRVTASGSVTFAGTSGGAGKMVKVRHPNGYETAYLHLSGYGKGVRRGVRVRQGDVIGFVGSTGLSTGPHLDYRVKKGGRYMDPMRLENKPAPPIPQHRLGRFLAFRDELRRALSGGDLPLVWTAELGSDSTPRQVGPPQDAKSTAAR